MVWVEMGGLRGGGWVGCGLDTDYKVGWVRLLNRHST